MTAVLLAMFLVVNARGEEARAVLEKAIQAHGGEDRIARTKTGHLQANVESTIVGSGVFKETWEETFDLPRRYRRVVDGKEGGQPFHREFVVNGTQGWERQGRDAVKVFPVTKTLPPEQHWHAVLLQILYLKAKETRLKYLGEEQRAGRLLIGIHAASVRGEADLFFDKSTLLLARARQSLADPMTGRQGIGETLYDDYRDIGGVRYPMHMKSSNGDNYIQDIKLTSIEFLDKLDPLVFAKPEGAPPHEADAPSGNELEKDAEDKTNPSAGVGVATPARWDVRLIIATLSVGVVVGVVWWIVRVSKRRSQETPQL
jgi:hypothetical protein